MRAQDSLPEPTGWLLPGKAGTLRFDRISDNMQTAARTLQKNSPLRNLVALNGCDIRMAQKAQFLWRNMDQVRMLVAGVL